MIFAAGLGTRLGAIGHDTPKALIEVGGKTMLERTVRRVVEAGADRVVVNLHHQADRVRAFVDENNFGVELHLSFEPERPLETGGGLWHARRLFRGDSPILLHNVDVITDADLGLLVSAHQRSGALAALAVGEREASRYLWFDESGLFGREDRRRGLERSESRPPCGAVRRWAFAGIQVCSPELLERITERGVFSIMQTYLRLAAAGARIEPWILTDALWLEIGNPERLEAARAAFGEAGAG